MIQGLSTEEMADSKTLGVIEDSPVGLPPVLSPSLWSKARRWSSSGRPAVALRGGAWSLGGYAATQLLRTVSTIILARLFLGPEAFGVVGLVGVFLAGLNMFSELGILANVVQHPRGDEPRFLNTAFSVQVARGMAIWLISVVAAYPLALFYKQPEIFPLLSVIGFSEMVRGLAGTSVWTLTRHIKLRAVTLLTVGAEVLAFGVCVAWALVSPSAWALVARTIASAIVYAAGSHFLSNQKTRLEWDSSAAKEILNFGGWMSLSTAAYFLSSQGERLILGKFVTAAELGCFSLAVMISSVPAGGVGQLVNQILLPMISKTARSGHAETLRDFLRARRLFFAVGMFAGIGFLVCAKPLIGLLLPPKYEMAGWMLQLLGLRVAMDIFSAPATAITIAYGESKYSAAASTVRLILMVGGVWIAFAMFGIQGAMYALIVSQVLSYFPLIAGLRKLMPEVAFVELGWYSLFIALLALTAAGLGMGHNLRILR